jgi:voltage-gated potassium channel Kch
MVKTFEQHHFSWLTLALVGLLLTGAFSQEMEDQLTLRLIEYASIALLMLSLLSLKTDWVWIKRFAVVIALLLVTVVSRGATDALAFEYLYLALLLVFLIMAGWLVASQVLLTGSVDLNKLVGAIALYLILGLIWSIFYVLLLEAFPDALQGIETDTWYNNLPLTTYFSFVTLTTLGYGDISPARPIAQVLVILEAVVGMFYLAVIVASLVGALRAKND